MTTTKCKIIIVDDNRDILDSIKLMLELEGHEVDTYDKGADMLSDLNNQETPHLILLDTWLSGEDGRNICYLLKNHEEYKKIPIIMMSASQDVKKSTFESGANYFISKPFNINEILDTIENFLQN